MLQSVSILFPHPSIYDSRLSSQTHVSSLLLFVCVYSLNAVGAVADVGATSVTARVDKVSFSANICPEIRLLMGSK